MSAWLCLASGLTMMVSVFIPSPIDTLIILASYFLMFAAYVIKDKYND